MELKGMRSFEELLGTSQPFHVDSYGLPAQADGDVNDQLQRTAMLAMGYYLSDSTKRPISWVDLEKALRNNLQPRPGVYCRFTKADPANCSADQLISALCYWVTIRDSKQIVWMAIRLMLRFGFAQNYKDGLGGNLSRIKIPDFMLIRALPLILRVSWALYPLTFFADILLVLSALTCRMPVWRDDKGFTKRLPDDVDDNLSIMTFAACRVTKPTPLSMIAIYLYSKLRPYNWGCVGINKCSPALGALRHYHRKESGGNPQIVDIWTSVIRKYFH